MANLLFYLVAVLAVVASVGVVACRNPILSVLCLLGSFFCLAVVYLLAGFQFMAAAQLLVYAGAIMVLFLFVIMLLNLGDPESLPGMESVGENRKIAIPMGVGGTLLLLGMVAVRASDLPATPEVTGFEDLTVLAATLFSKYTLPFEAAGILLLAATLAVLVLAKRQRPGSATATAQGSALGTDPSPVPPRAAPMSPPTPASPVDAEGPAAPEPQPIGAAGGDA